MALTATTEMAKRHSALVRAYSNIAERVVGAAAFVWLPGKQQKFDGYRAIRGPGRPIGVSLEATPNGGLVLAGSVAYPRSSKLVYDVLFQHEFTAPLRQHEAGPTISASVIVRRGIHMLEALVALGKRRARAKVNLSRPKWPQLLVPFVAGQEVYDEAKLDKLAEGVSSALFEMYRSRLRRDLTHFDGRTVYVNAAVAPDDIIAHAVRYGAAVEDYSPVLGVEHWNPIQALHEMPNPAEEILERHDTTVDELGSPTGAAQLAAVLADFRASVPLGGRLTEDEIFEALAHPGDLVQCAKGVEDIPHSAVVTAMRRAAGRSRAAAEATYRDLLVAAQNPDRPLVLSRLSVTQLVAADDLVSLPEPYAGHFLSRLDWAPSEQRVTVG